MVYPNTIVLDGARLAETKVRLASNNDVALQTALKLVEIKADQWLKTGPWSVINKKQLPPSGDVHDYTSQAPYWWPSPSPNGSPYVQRDGEKNPEVYSYSDRQDVEKVFKAS